MSTSDREALLELLRGLATGYLIVGVFVIFVLSLGGENKPLPKFEVVDEYRGCAVVRYVPENTYDAHYFLDCSK